MAPSENNVPLQLGDIVSLCFDASQCTIFGLINTVSFLAALFISVISPSALAAFWRCLYTTRSRVVCHKTPRLLWSSAKSEKVQGLPYDAI